MTSHCLTLTVVLFSQSTVWQEEKSSFAVSCCIQWTQQTGGGNSGITACTLWLSEMEYPLI